jgi:membrane-associated phospholipid phosphatase
MKIRWIVLLVAILCVTRHCAAQENPETNSEAQAAPNVSPAMPITAPAAVPVITPVTKPVITPVIAPITTPITKISPEREVSWRLLVPNLLQDQKQIWMFPVSVAHGHHLKPTLAFLGITAGLIALDERDMKMVRSTQSFNGFNKVFSGFNTSTSMEVFPALFYAIGLMRKDSYAQKTVLLAGEAVIDAEIVTTVLKDIDRRYRPASVGPNGDLSASWFKETNGSYFGGVGSFPSGHAIAAFSVATVFADRYPNPHWHVWLAYGLASLVGFSRVTTQSHFPSDVFAGAAIGYVIAHYVVRHPKEIPMGDDLHASEPEPQTHTAGSRLPAQN